MNVFISLFQKETQSKNGTETDIQFFLSDIKNQKYEDKVMKIRVAKQENKNNTTK